MRTRHLLHHVLGCAVLALLPAAQAEPDPPAARAPQPAGCAAPAYDGPALLHRAERLSQFEALGADCLKQLMVACDVAATRQLLDPGSAFSCSIGYEALLKRGFGGDFRAMLAWWHSREGASGLL